MTLRSLAIVFALCLAACDEKKDPAPAPPASAAPVVVETPSAAPSSVATAAEPAKVPDAIAAQHVLVAYKGAKNAPKTVTRSKAEAKKRAEEVVAKAKAGGDFTALVAEYSDDAATKDRMGSLGKFTREKMVKPFSDAAFALRDGETSDAVETDFGFHVIKRNQ